MPLTSDVLTDLYQRKEQSAPPAQTGGSFLSFLWDMISPETHRVWDKYMEGQYDNADWKTVAADLLPDNTYGVAQPSPMAMVRMGGAEFPNAFLHRALGDPKELDWLANLFQEGLSTQKPTSAVTPSVLSTFGSEPFGLMFNVNEPRQIAWAGAQDLWSNPEKIIPEQLTRAWDTLPNKLPHGPTTPRLERYQAAMRKLGDMVLRAKEVAPETWTPPLSYRMPTGIEEQAGRTLIDPQSEGLDRLLQSQRGLARRNYDPATPLDLTHSEIIPNLDRSMLAGVRLPLYPDLEIPESNIGGAQQLYAALSNFAEQQHVPIFRWPAEMTQEQQLKGLEDPFTGKWGRPPGSDYITSSRLPQIFGITQNDLP